MPPKQKITKDELLRCGYQIAEQQGIAAVTSRSIARLAGCSIQPVFSHFPTMELLRQEVFNYACRCFMEEILPFQGRPDFPALVSKWTLDLARSRPNLYKLLYISDGFPHTSMEEMMLQYESNQKMMASLCSTWGLTMADAQAVLVRSCLLLSGICTMICINHMEISDKEALTMVSETVQDMIERKKKKCETSL